eukprot:603379_1
MRGHSYQTSQATPRTRIPQYYHRPTPLTASSSHPDIESPSRQRSFVRNVGDNVFYHHHQHHHNYHLPRTHSPHNNTSCDIKKFLIYAILFFAAYYILFLAISTTYRHNTYSKSLRKPSIPPRVSRMQHQDHTDFTSEDEEHFKQQLKRGALVNPFLSADMDNALKTALAGQEAARTASKVSEILDERRTRRKRHRQEISKLKPFPQIYISDAPYYLHQNLVIIGQVNNAETRMDMVLYQLEGIACLFNSTTFILFESNSKDKTLLHLQRWSLRKPLNCTQIAFKPEHKQRFGSIETLDDLMETFALNKHDKEGIEDNDVINNMIWNYLDQFTSLGDIDYRQMMMYLTAKLLKMNFEQIEVEEILRHKLEAIKHVIFRRQIEKHQNAMHKHIISGDEVVEDELLMETEILRQLRVYGGLNERDPSGYYSGHPIEGNDESVEQYKQRMVDDNGDLVAIFMDEAVGGDVNKLDTQYQFREGVREQELKRYTPSDLFDEFKDIHAEMEGLMQYDEDIIHEKLRERKRKYEARRRKERSKREAHAILKLGDEEFEDGLYQRLREKLENIYDEDDESDDDETRFRTKLFRIERFVIYRNMLLNETQRLSAQLNIKFDYVLVIDMDIYSFDARTFMNEMYFADADAVCMDGMDWMGYTRDTFATVKTNGGWLHYGHDALVNKTRYVYDNQHAMRQRTKIPNEKHRFEQVKSCFGGVMVYNNIDNHLFEQECKYTLTRDIFWTDYKNDPSDMNETVTNLTVTPGVEPFNYTYEWWLDHRHHNAYSEQSKVEIQLFLKQYVELIHVFGRTVQNRALIPRDGDICEHIPYHYCLGDKGWKFVISTRSKLYYDKFYPGNRNDTNWPHHLETRPSFTV